MKISVINGPNLNLLGTREPEIYGSATLSDIENEISEKCIENGHICSFFQSNSEGAIIDALHKAADCDGIILNAGAYTHYSYALRDAVTAIKTPVIEVHLSNIHSREDFRTNSVIAPVCAGSIFGFGRNSYILALEAIFNKFV